MFKRTRASGTAMEWQSGRDPDGNELEADRGKRDREIKRRKSWTRENGHDIAVFAYGRGKKHAILWSGVQ
jgi:hypothetical protein